jgi:hypothetical protein
MDNGHWEIGVCTETLDDLLTGAEAGNQLWFLAGYLKGFSDSQSFSGDHFTGDQELGSPAVDSSMRRG